jgi:adenylate kinase family enzyme
LDGFPRTLQNYNDFDAICGAPECALYIDVPDEVMIQRILNRGKGGSGRSDDNIETAKRRIETFHELTVPTLDCLNESGVPVHALDGTGSPDDVWEQLLSLDTPVGRLAKQRNERSILYSSGTNPL